MNNFPGARLLIGTVLLVGCAIPGRATVAQEVFELTVVATGADPDVGQAIVSLFGSEATYLKEPSTESVVDIDSLGRATVKFRGLAAGTYAVSAIYDKDSDGELDTGFLGIPREPIAMSNDARGRFGPPKFEESSFALSKTMTIEIRFAKAKRK